eukprot:10221220-Lingulodinium_polyedra.AAC.1
MALAKQPPQRLPDADWSRSPALLLLDEHEPATQQPPGLRRESPSLRCQRQPCQGARIPSARALVLDRHHLSDVLRAPATWARGAERREPHSADLAEGIVKLTAASLQVIRPRRPLGSCNNGLPRALA